MIKADCQKLSLEVRQRLLELFVLADEVISAAKISSREEKQFREQLKQVDIHASAFRALIARFKLENILEYYI